MKNRNWKQEIKDWWKENKSSITSGFAIGVLGAFAGYAAGMTADELRWYKVERFLKKNGTITNAEVRQMFQVSSATANRILARFTDEGKLQKIRIGRSWGYRFL